MINEYYYADIIRMASADSVQRNPQTKPAKYIQNVVNKDVYKYQPKHGWHLCQSPWNKDRTRFMTSNEDLNLYRRISDKEAGRILNEQWDKHDAEWVHNGKHYCTKGVFHEEGTSCNPCPKHQDSDGLCYFIGYYRGHLYKVVYYAAWDDISFVELRAYEERHRNGRFVNFRVRTKHIKIVWCITDNKYV